MSVEYLEDKNSDDFIKYIFSTNPKPKNHIKLELDEPPQGIHRSMYIYKELLQIFIDGLFYLRGHNNKLNINNLSLEDIELMKKYFISFGFIVNLDIFEPDKYELRQPNLLLNTEFITDKTKINDYFYEIIDMDNNDNINKTYRITFDFI